MKNEDESSPTELISMSEPPPVDDTSRGGDQTERGMEHVASDSSVPHVEDPRTARLTILAQKGLLLEPLLLMVTMAQTITVLFEQYMYDRLAGEFNVTSVDEDPRCRRNSMSNITKNDTGQEERSRSFHAEVSIYNTAMMFSHSIPLLIFINFIGAYSDSAGRRRVLITSQIACLVSGIITIVVMAFDLPLYLILVAYVIKGLTGGVDTTIMIAYAYVSDIFTGTRRFYKILLVELVTGIGLIIGNLLFGLFVQYIGYVYTCLISQVIALLALGFTIFCIKETVPHNPNAKFFSAHLISKVPKVLCYNRNRGFQTVPFLLALTVLLYNFPERGVTGISSYYFKDPPLCWESDLIGIFNAVSYFIKGVVGVTIIKRLGKWISDMGRLILGITSLILYNLALAASVKTWIPFVGAALGSATMITGATIRGVGSKVVHTDEQGALFAGLAWCTVLASVLASPLFNYIYSVTSVGRHAAVMFIAALLCIPSIITSIVLWVMRTKVKLATMKDAVNIDGETVTPDDPIIQN